MSCQLILLNYEDQYCPGCTIEGKVICTFVECEDIKDIKVKLVGRENTEWTVEKLVYYMNPGVYKQIPLRSFGRNGIIKNELTLSNTGTSTQGTFEYPFKIELPKNIPSSFKGTYGQLYYYLKATVQFCSNLYYEDVKDISIEGPIDLNDVPYAFSKQYTKYSDEQVLNLCCLGKVPTMDVFLDKEGFIIGEPIRIIAFIRNESNKDIKHVRVQLNRIIMEKVTTPKIETKYETEIISSERYDGVKANQVKTYTYELKVPSSIILHNLWNSKLFKELFTLTVATELSDGHDNLMVEVRLVIGKIPFTTWPIVNHMNVPGGTPYPPLMNLSGPDHMNVPGGTPYPPLMNEVEESGERGETPYLPFLCQPSCSSMPFGDQRRVSRGNAASRNDPLPSYQEAIGNPIMYPPPPS